MKTLVSKTVLITLLVLGFVLSSAAQRVIRGTVYREGKPAAGVTVEAHRGANSAFTDFDGKYELLLTARPNGSALPLLTSRKGWI